MRGLDADIAVVGAGIAGASAALGLARAGWRVALIEAREPGPWSPQQEPDLRVYALAQASGELFARLGVWPELLRRGLHPYRRMRVWDAAGGGELEFDAADIARPELGWIAPQAPVQDALWQALARDPRVQRHCPDRIEELESGPGEVRVELDSGRRLRVRLLIAADGARSPTRERLGIASALRDYAQRAVVAYVSHAEPHADTCWQRFLPSGPLAFLPCTDGRSSIVWTLPQAEAERVLALDHEAFQRELERAFDARLGSLTEVSQRASFPLVRRIAERFVQGRIALLGDAARNVHPLAGQGLNLGLADVRVLLDALGEALPGRDPGTAGPLARYARSRRSDSSVAALAFEQINRLFSNDHPISLLLRGPALGMVDRLVPLRRLFAAHAAGWGGERRAVPASGLQREGEMQRV